MARLRIILPSFILLALVFFQSAGAFALDVHKVRFGIYEGKNRLVLDISETSDFRAFVLSSPYRMVVDMPTFDWQAGTIVKPPNSGVTDIRQGALQPGISRIVFDLNRPISIKSAFLLPQHGERSNRLVIDFQSIATNDFVQEKGKIHGTLSVQNMQSPSAVKTLAGAPAIDLLNPGRPPIPPRKSFALKPLIIVDPGHGGVDPGASGPGKLYEKHVVLALAKELRRQLLATGRYRVKLTRERDVFIRLSDRVGFARKANGDLFISIHADSIHKPDVRGASVYTLSQKASDAQTAKLAEKENKADLIAGIDLSVEDEQVANILFDFAMTDTMNQSKFFANTLVGRMKGEGVHTLENTHRYAGFAVLKAPDVPSVLIEAGFMSNRKEARMLNQASYRKKIASSIRSGVDAYFEHVRITQRN